MPDPTTTTTGPNGTTEQTPSSAITPGSEGGPPTLAGTGDGTNPVSTTQAPTLSQAESQTTYSTGLSGNIESEHREQAGDLDEVKRLNDLMAVLKSLNDGGKLPTGNSAVLGDLAKRAHLSGKDQMVLNNLNPGFWTQAGSVIQGLTTSGGGFKAGPGQLSPAGVRALRTVASQAVRAHMTSLGLDPQGATTYQQLLKVWTPDHQELARQAQDSRGQTQPLAPFERTNDLITLLSDLETGKSTSNVNPEVYRAMVARSGEPTAYDPQAVGANASTAIDPEHLQNTVSDAIRAHMTAMGIDPGNAVTAQQLKAVQPSSAALGQFQAEGFSLKGVTTFGSLAQTVHQQAIQSPDGSAIPGGLVKTSTPAQTSMKGAQIYSNFQQAWKANQDNFRERTVAALNGAGITASMLSSTDYGAVASAFVQAMSQTKAGGSVWGTIDAAVTQNQGGQTYQNPAYAQVMAVADKIGTHLTTEEANHLAALYGGSSSTGDVDALSQAVASYYQYDDNEEPRPGSYAATAQQAISDEYGKYGITLTSAQSGAMVQDLLKQGGADLSSLYTAGDAASAYAEQRAKTAASALYPSLAPFISQGQTLAGSGGLLAPYQSSYAQMMGVDPSTINVSDPDFIKLVAQETGTTTGAAGTEAAGPAVGQPKGQSTAATGGLKSLDQFQAAVMQSPKGIGGAPAWQNTENAEAAYSGMANYLLGSMGFSPTASQSNPGPSPTEQGLS